MDPAHTTPRAVGIPDIVKDEDPYCVLWEMDCATDLILLYLYPSNPDLKVEA